MEAVQSRPRMTRKQSTPEESGPKSGPASSGVRGQSGSGTTGSSPAGPSSSGKRELDSMADLAIAAAQGDHSAFEAIHRRLSGGLHRLFMERSAGRTEVAEDLNQRTWLAVWDSLQKGRYDPSRSAITTFVYAVGYKMWLQYLRTASRPEMLVPDIFEGSRPELATPEYEAGVAELLTAVRQCLKNDGEESVLSEEERGIIRASAAGSSDRDIAKQLRIAASTLNARKQAAIDKIRRFLAGGGHRQHSDERR